MSDYFRQCTACHQELQCNMYGMGTCPRCGFKDNPVQSDNAARAHQWRLDKGLPHPNLERGTSMTLDTGILCNQIREGIFDNALEDILLAVTDRNKIRRQDVMNLVHEVFGPNATINQTR